MASFQVIGQVIYKLHFKIKLVLLFIGGTDAEAETPVLWPPHAKS